MRVLIAVDKFKGTLRADEVVKAVARGWRKIRPGDALVPFPVSDGGDGFGEILGAALGAGKYASTACDAARRKIRSHWWFDKKTGTAIVESASSIGLALLPRGRFHPFELDTFGLGLVLRDVLRHSPQKILIGLGGSATNDGGFGMARALGWKFLDRRGHELNAWTELGELIEIEAPKQDAALPEFVIASDCENPLLGPEGATSVYGPQKGLRKKDLAKAEANLARLAKVFQKQSGKQCHLKSGAGAAGGLGFGILGFLNGKVISGFKVFSEASNFQRALARSDLVISAEGSIDRSSLMGKAVGEVLKSSKRNRNPVVLLGGRASLEKFPAQVLFARGLTDLTNVKNAMKNPAPYLELLSSLAALEVSSKFDSEK